MLQSSEGLTHSDTSGDETAAVDWSQLAEQTLAGRPLSRARARAVTAAPDDQLLELLQCAFKVRSHRFGRKVKVHVLRNAKSGVCPEDCMFCSQSLRYGADVPQYAMQHSGELAAGADQAIEMGAVTYCMVTSTRGPTEREIERVCDAATKIKAKHPELKLCASLGMLKSVAQAERLAAAGIDRYNHNLETSPRYFAEIVTTHQFSDRVGTIKLAKAAGMEACCGGILGMGEQPEDWIDLAFALRELDVESIPINFLDPRPGTPLADQQRLAPRDALRALALFRLAHPRADLRIAGGREVTLRALQPLALFPANSIFTNGYLTTPGAKPSTDHQMIIDAGFTPEVTGA